VRLSLSSAEEALELQLDKPCGPQDRAEAGHGHSLVQDEDLLSGLHLAEELFWASLTETTRMVPL
jgi:hypothetical protein